MRAVDVRVHRRKTVSETLGDKRLRCQVVTLIEFMPADDVKDARVILQTRGM